MFVYRSSSFKHIMTQNQFFFVSGDSAYPISRFVLTPFRDTGRLTPCQKYFNTRISSARQCVERAIGHIKCRFRRLRDIHCCDILEICKLVMAACILHNLCVLNHDEITEYLDQDNIDNNRQINNYPPVFPNTAEGIHKRNQLVEYLQQFMH